MKFGEMLTHAANFSAVGAAGPSFAWASPNDIVILGKTPDDINGRVCLVSLPDDEKRRFVRLYRHGNTIKTYYMDDYDCSGEYPANGVEVHGEVLAIVHQYGVEPEAPKASTAWEKRVKKALKGRFISFKDQEQILKRHTNAGRWTTLNVAYCLGAEAGRKEAILHHFQKSFLLLDFGKLIILLPEKLHSGRVSCGLRGRKSEGCVVGEVTFQKGLQRFCGLLNTGIIIGRAVCRRFQCALHQIHAFGRITAGRASKRIDFTAECVQARLQDVSQNYAKAAGYLKSNYPMSSAN